MKRFATMMVSLILVISCLVSGSNTYIAQASMGGFGFGGRMMFGGLSEAEQEWVEEAKLALQEILQERTVMALVYLTDNYPVRSMPDAESDVVVAVPSGQTVQILDVEVLSAAEVWEYVTFFHNGNQYYGYVERGNLACSDELFLDWEDSYGMNPAARGLMTLTNDGQSVSDGDGGNGGAQILPADIAQFPQSYQSALLQLKEAHPNWTFVKFNTNLNWSEVVTNQMVAGRNLIHTSFPAYMWNGVYGQSWGHVTEDTLKYYLDPRNGLTEELIFQFEQLTYNASYHTEAALQTFLNGTFMSGKIPNTVLTYAYAIYMIGKEQNISPFHIACRIYQEQGDGTSPLISGNYEGKNGTLKGYYNYFNIGATGRTDEEVIVSGLERAKREGWTDGYHSIYGGAKILAANYILHGQDTLYLQKFDVDKSYDGLYWHQYMQNISAPSSEGKNIRKSYERAGSLDNTFVFKIPVYNSMPGSACPKPEPSKKVELTVPQDYKDTMIYLDGVEYAAAKENGKLVVTAPDMNAKTAVMYQYNENGVPVGMNVWELDGKTGIYHATEVPELKNLLSYHGFSIRITGKTGIRFKTGIDETLKKQLVNAQAAGYSLKEYGTLVMNQANRQSYPMIKGGEKVASGLSYGYNTNGKLEDKVYETVSGRQRFTSVLVGLPVSQYKTEFAFRGYAVLTKEGNEVTIYGPAVYRSIYNLAQQILNLGQYPAGSSADQFLRKLISDADAYEAANRTAQNNGA